MFNRKSIRLQSYDYSIPGYYFITICLQERHIHRLGTVKNGSMNVTEAGAIASFHWSDIPNHYPTVTLDAWVIMPNHMHGIIIIHDEHPEAYNNAIETINELPNANTVGAIHELPQEFVQNSTQRTTNELPKQQSQHQRRKMTLSKAIGRFKMQSSKSINAIQNNPGRKFWQRNYYEHIIRNEQDYTRIKEYILNNPRKWEQDKFH